MEYSNGKWDIPALKGRGFRPGSVVRVKMMNFLTYDNCEVFPGPRLNVILGPNGTGKSTLTHAICLACTGKPETVGRSPELKQFVKRGKEGQECFVEVDLLSSDSNSVYTVRRTIRSNDNSSTWHLSVNNKEKSVVNQTKIKEIMNSLSIDVNNLCSFMPQDRVGLFTNYTPQEILSATLKCIPSAAGGDKTLYDEQIELAGVETQKMNREKDLTAKESIINNIRHQRNGLKAEVERMQNRNETIKKLELYQMKLCVVRCQEYENTRNEIQEQIDAINTSLVRAQEKIAPLELKAKDLKRQQNVRDKASETAKTNFLREENKLRALKSTVEDIDASIEAASNELEAITRNRAHEESKLATAKAEVAKLEAELAKALASITKYEEGFRTANAELRVKVDEENRLTEEMSDISSRGDAQRRELISNTQRELSSLRDAKEVFLSRMIRDDKTGGKKRDTKVAYDWINKNRSLFEKEVFGPIGVHLQVENPVCGEMLAKAIPYHTLTSGFIAQTKNDADILKRELRTKQNLRIDVNTVTHVDIPPRHFSNTQLSQLRHIGLQGYLSDQMLAPEVVKAYLFQSAGIHQVLWCRCDLSTTSITNEDLSKLASSNVNSIKIYVENTQSHRGGGMPEMILYSGSKSQYHSRGEWSIVSETLRPSGLLSQGLDDASTRRVELENTLESVKQQQREVGLLVNSKSVLLDAIKSEKDRLRARKIDFQNGMKIPEAIRRKLELSKRTVTQCEKSLSVNIGDLKRNKLDEYMTEVGSLQQNISVIANVGRGCISFQVAMVIHDQRRNELRAEIRAAEDALEEARAETVAVTRRMKTHQRELEDVEKLIKRAVDELAELERVHGGQENFDALYAKVIEVCPEETVDGIELAIATHNLRVQSMVNNPAVLHRYEELGAQLTVLEEEYEVMQRRLVEDEASLERRSAGWLDSVTNVAYKLNTLFGEFMSELKFRGEVELIKTGKFDAYEIQMKVSFRENEGITNLTGQRQSGGERTVSTVMYLMALQDMTSSPFRVVDEINQGMDERNERLVFDRIVRSCCGGSNRPQYYLVSPKLLQGLKSMTHDDVTVLIICNGPGARLNWHLPTFSKSMKRLLPAGTVGSQADTAEKTNDNNNNNNHHDTDIALLQQAPLKKRRG